MDSIRKKINVVQDIVDKLGLGNVTTYAVRAEKINLKFHFVIGRAVTNLPRLLEWIGDVPFAEEIGDQKNGIIYLKGDPTEEDLKAFSQAKVIPVAAYFSESYFHSKKIIFIPSSVS